MSRAHCIDCGSAVVVDPTGLCPEGHLVGSDGARIEAAIGVGVPYPDEPEPWSMTVEVAEPGQPDPPPVPRAPVPPTAPDAGTVLRSGPANGDGPPSPTPSTAEPPSAMRTPPAATPETPAAATTPPPAVTAAEPAPLFANRPQPAPAAPSAAPPDAGDTDDLMRELHSLSELDELATAIAADADDGSTPPADDAPSAPPVAAPPSNDAAASAASEHRDGIAELRALEAAVQALTGGDRDDGPAEVPDAGADPGVVRPLPTTGRPADDGGADHLAEVAHLFGDRSSRPAEPHRPSQAGPPASNESPRPAFQRTPWSTAELADDASPSSVGAGGAGAANSHQVPEGSDAPIDLGNFTARGRRVGTRAETKRRRRGR